MATLRIDISKHLRADNKYQVRIRLTHNRDKAYIKTPYYVSADDLDKNGLILSKELNVELSQRIINYEKKIIALSTRINEYSVSELAQKIESSDQEEDINIIKYFRGKIETFVHTKSKQTVKGYHTALDRLISFIGTDALKTSNFTVRLLNDFEIHMRTVPRKEKKVITGKEKKVKVVTGTTIRLYMTYLSTLASIAEKEDVILKNPFRKGYVKPQSNNPEQRLLEVETIRKILNDTPEDPREQFGQDVFKLSFCLAGMNTADMFTCLQSKIKGRIQYNRQKTKRRKDKAFTSLSIPSEIKNLVDKYSDNDRQFNFYKLFTNPGQFNKRVNRGLELLCNRLEIEPITTYHARHSFASYARNECNIPIDEVDLALVHKDNYSMTNIYTKTDWSKVERAQRAVLDFVYETKAE